MTTEQVSEITVGGERPYTVAVGRGLFGRVPPLLRGASKALIVHQPTSGTRAEALRESLSDAGIEALLAEVPDAEDAKRVEVAAFCWQILGKADFTRSDAVIGLGGGAVTDLAGFVAATWLRGVRLVQLPTSVLAMADAAVGGKTGINTAEGKNLVGSFYAPAGVLCDLDALRTLPENEFLTGYAEIVKCGLIGAAGVLAELDADFDAAVDSSTDAFHRALVAAIRLKADVVAEDFRESGRREFLNYGHTLGHAIEYAERYQWRHGAAVSVGMVYAAHLSNLTGHLDDAGVELHYRYLQRLGLPVRYRAGLWDTLLAAMHRDKKARGTMLRFIILDAIGKPTRLAGPEPDLLYAAYQEVAE